MFAHEIEILQKRRARVRVDVLVGEVDERLGVREQVEQLFANAADFFTEPAFELLRCRAQREVGLRPDQIHHGLGLGEIHFAVEERALGELARLRPARTVCEHGIEHAPCHEDAAVAVDLDDILAGVARRRAVHTEQHVVNRVRAVGDFAELLHARWQLASLFFRQKNRVGDGDRARPGEADHGEGALAKRRRDGGDGVVHRRHLKRGHTKTRRIFSSTPAATRYRGGICGKSRSYHA